MAISENIIANLEARGGAAMAATMKMVERTIIQLGESSMLAGRGAAFLTKSTLKLTASVANVDHVVGAAERAMVGLSVTATVTAKALDRVQDQAHEAGSSIREMGNHAVATTLKLATLSATVGTAGLLSFAAGAGVVSAVLIAMQAAAAGAIGTFLGFGVMRNAIDEAAPLQEAIKNVNKQLEKLEEKGITSGPAYDALKKNLADLESQYNKTFLGMADSLKHFFITASTTISKPLFDVLKVQLEKLVNYVNSPAVQSQIPKLTQRVADGIANVTAWFERSKPSLIAWGRAILTIGQALSGPVAISMKMFASGFGKVNSQSAAFQDNISQISRIMEFFGRMMVISSTILNGLVGGIVRGLAPALDSLSHSLNAVVARAGGLPAFLDRVSAVATTIGRSLGSVIGAVLKFGVALGKAGESLGLWRFLYAAIVKGSALIVSGLERAGTVITTFAENMHKDMARLGPTIFIALKLFEGLAVALVVITPILSKVALVAGLLLNPFGLLAIAASFLGAAVITNFAGIRDKALPVLDRLKVLAIGAKKNLLIFWAALTGKTINTDGLSKTGQFFFYLGEQASKLIPKIIELYKTFSPLAIALRAIEAFGTGGIAGVMASLGDSFSNIGGVIGGLASKIVPILGNLTAIALNWVAEFAPIILNGFLSIVLSVGDALIPLVPKIIGGLGRVITAVLGWLDSVAPTVLSTIARWAGVVFNALIPLVGPIVAGLARLVGTLINWLGSQTSNILNGALRVGLAISAGLLPSVPTIIRGLARIISSALSWLQSNSGTIFSTVEKWSSTVFRALIPEVGPIVSKLATLFLTLIGELARQGPSILSGFLALGVEVANALIPKTDAIIGGLLTLVANLISWVGDNSDTIIGIGASLFEHILLGISSNLGKVTTAISDLIPKVTTALIAKAPDLLDAGLTLFTGLMTSMTLLAPKVIEAASLLIGRLLDWLSSNSETILNAALTLFGVIATSIISNLPAVTKALVTLIGRVVEWFDKNKDQILDAAIGLFLGLVDSLTQVLPQIIKGVTTVLTSIIAKLTEPAILSQLVEAGVGFILSIVDSMTQALPQIIQGLASLLNALIRRITEPETMARIIDAGINLLVSLADAAIAALPKVIEGVFTLISGIITELTKPETLTKLINAGVTLLTKLTESIATALPPIIEGISTMLTELIKELLKPENIQKFIDAGIKIFTAIVKMTTTLLPIITDAVIQFTDTLLEEMKKPEVQKSLLDGGIQLFTAFIEGAARINNVMQQMLLRFGKMIIGHIVEGLLNDPGAIFNAIGSLFNFGGGGGKSGGGFKIPGFASGGIVTSPTLAMVGEGGQAEAIIPLIQLQRMVERMANIVSQSSAAAMMQAQPVTAAPSPNQIYNQRSSVSSYTDARQWNLSTTTQQSTGSIISDYGILQAMGR